MQGHHTISILYYLLSATPLRCLCHYRAMGLSRMVQAKETAAAGGRCRRHPPQAVPLLLKEKAVAVATKKPLQGWQHTLARGKYFFRFIAPVLLKKQSNQQRDFITKKGSI